MVQGSLVNSKAKTPKKRKREDEIKGRSPEGKDRAAFQQSQVKTRGLKCPSRRFKVNDVTEKVKLTRRRFPQRDENMSVAYANQKRREH